jgi:predicted DCC family thiol-disulfide oxidoreductase YuxK
MYSPDEDSHVIEAPSVHGGASVLFDGTCAFCEGAARFIARHDPAGYFRFGVSQSPEGAALLVRHGVRINQTRSIVLIEGGEVYLRSTASLRIASRLPLPWRAAAICLAIPRPVRDGLYDLVAALRHHLAGTSNACEMPPPEIRDRLIGGSLDDRR